MIKKLFGETEEEQYRYLKPRLMAFGVGLIALLLGAILSQLLGIEPGAVLCGLGAVICYIDLFIFGWAFMRGLFGIASVGILFSRNVVLAVVIFLIYFFIGYIGGLVAAVMGLCRFLVLSKKGK